MRMPDTNKPIGTLSPRVIIANPYQMRKYIMREPKLRYMLMLRNILNAFP